MKKSVLTIAAASLLIGGHVLAGESGLGSAKPGSYKVEVSVPQRGEKKALMEMVVKNAAEAAPSNSRPPRWEFTTISSAPRSFASATRSWSSMQRRVRGVSPRWCWGLRCSMRSCVLPE